MDITHTVIHVTIQSISIMSDVENSITLPDEFVAPHLDARTCLGRGTDCL